MSCVTITTALPFQPMEQDQAKSEANGPNPPTQVDKVSTSEVNKPDGHVTTELADAKKGSDASQPPQHPQVTEGE